MPPHYTTLRLNDDEVWILYRLTVGDLHTDTPCGISTEPHDDHEFAARSALTKLSEAMADIQNPPSRRREP